MNIFKVDGSTMRTYTSEVSAVSQQKITDVLYKDTDYELPNHANGGEIFVYLRHLPND